MTAYDSLIIQELKELSSQEKSYQLSSFFKTGKGDYAEKDIFWGVKAPEIRNIIKKYYKDISLSQIQILLDSPVHEQRYAGLHCLVYKYSKTQENKKIIIDFYLQNIHAINNWDLVDTTAPHLLGAWSLDNRSTSINWKLAKSGELWKERIAIVSTLYYIKHNDFAITLELAEYFLHHPHDLIQKAVGWMLREVGKREEKILIDFLDKYYKTMPRTMLRYAIERLSTEQKKYYMKK